MSYQKEDLIKYRLEKSIITFSEAKSLAESEKFLYALREQIES